MSNWKATATSFITHTLAFGMGAGFVFIILAAALSQSFEVNTPVGKTLCVIIGK